MMMFTSLETKAFAVQCTVRKFYPILSSQALYGYILSRVAKACLFNVISTTHTLAKIASNFFKCSLYVFYSAAMN